MNSTAPDHFSDVLTAYVRRSRRTAGQLASLTGIPEKTIVSWLEGRVKQPRQWQDVILLAGALHLSEAESDRLLLVAGHPRVATLTAPATLAADQALLSPWLAPPELREEALHAPFMAPPLVSNIVGREAELNLLRRVLGRPGELVIVHGMAGVGKTVVAMELVYGLRSEFEDGILWADLREATDEKGEVHPPALKSILSAFAQAYGLDLHDKTSLAGRATAVRTVLTNKRSLLMLDGADSSDVVKMLLPPSDSACSVLITTRNRRLIEDQEGERLALQPLEDGDCLALLREIVGVERIERELPGARRLVQLVGGLPMAVRVIAAGLAETQSLTLLEYYELLLDERSRLAYLVDWEDASKDIRASFEVSYTRLSPELRQIFMELALFAGNDFSEEAVAAVTGKPLVFAKRFLSQLHSLSLVESGGNLDSLRFSTQQSGQYRYRLHPLLRTFTSEKLLGQPAARQTGLGRLVDYFARFVADNQTDYALLARDWDNISSLLKWLQAEKLWPQLTTLIEALTTVNLGAIGFLDVAGYWEEAADWLVPILANLLPESRLRPLMLFKQGAFAFRLAKLEVAEAALRQSIELAERSQAAEPAPSLVSGWSCGFLMELSFNRGMAVEALEWAARGLATLGTLDTETAQHEVGYLEIRQATILARLGRLEEGQALAESGLRRLPPTPSPAHVSGFITLGNIAIILGDHGRGRALYQDGLEEATALQDTRRRAQLQQNIAVSSARTGDMQGALTANREAIKQYERIGDTASLAAVYTNLGVDHMSVGDYEAAEVELDKALLIASRNRYTEAEYNIYLNQIRWHLDQNQLAQAAAIWRQAQNFTEALSLELEDVELLRLQAEVAWREGNARRGAELIASCLEVVQDAYEKGLSLRLHGEILASLAATETAEAAFTEAEALFAGFNEFERAKTALSRARALERHGQDERTVVDRLHKALEIFQRQESEYYVALTAAQLLIWGDNAGDQATVAEPTPAIDAELLIAGRYVQERLLASGGQGNVYLGHDTRRGGPVAIKRLKPHILQSDPSMISRFNLEADLLRQLDHPNIVASLATQRTEDDYILVMEYVGGGTLRELLESDGRLSLLQTLQLAVELSDALSRTHHLGIVHRDLKPDNILLTESGRPKLTDFGIARITQQPSNLTLDGQIMGTIDYISPESFQGEEIDQRADIWAYGIILFEMLVGKCPFAGSTFLATMLSVMNEPMPDLSTLRPDIPLELYQLVENMLRKDRTRRVSRIRQVAAEFELILDALA